MPYIGYNPLTKAERNVIDHVVVDAQTTYQASYTPGFIDVILNGSVLQSSEYIATNGTDFTLNTATVSGDTLTTVAWGTFQTASIAPNSVTEQALNVRELQVAGLIPTAWCAYNAVTGTILSAYNIQSVTYEAAGKYLFNFTNQMDTSNYSVSTSGVSAFINNDTNNVPNSTSSFHIWTRSSSLADYDGELVSVHVFGGLV